MLDRYQYVPPEGAVEARTNAGGETSSSIPQDWFL